MKREIKTQFLMYPTPVVIVGTQVNGKNNFINIAHIGIIDMNTVSLSMGKPHYSNQGIKKYHTCSLNFFSRSEIIPVDYVGMVSGAQTDKSSVFETEKGELEGAPLIKSAKIAMECEVIEVIDRGSHDLFLIQPKHIYAEDSILTGDKVDLKKLDPLLFDMESMSYWSVGENIGRCWSEGKKYNK